MTARQTPTEGRDYLLGEPTVTIRQIQTLTAHRYGISLHALVSPRRKAKLVQARHEAMAQCIREERWSLPEIGRAFKRDHTTVIYAGRKMGVL